MSDLDFLLKSSTEGSRLQAELGTPLLLQIDGVESHLKSCLVGMEPGCFIVARAPKSASVESKLFAGNQGVVRYLWGGTVFTFQTTLLGYINQPFPLVFLSYPKVISRVELRREPRFECYIPAQLQVINGLLSGVILDLSRGGCRFLCRLGAKDSPKAPVMGQEVSLSVNLGMEEAIYLDGVVRNIKQEAQSITLGISFEQLKDSALGSLDRCIRTLQDTSRGPA